MQKRETAINHTPVPFIGMKHPLWGFRLAHVNVITANKVSLKKFKIMNARVISIEKSKTFGNEVRGQKRYVAVIEMCRTTDGGSKFACGAFGTNNIYKLSIDLVAVYGDDAACKNDEGNFSANKAFEALRREYTPEGVGLYDIDLGGTYIVKETKREMTTARIAIYGTEEDAKKYAMRSLARDLDAGRILRKEEKKEEKNEEEE